MSQFPMALLLRLLFLVVTDASPSCNDTEPSLVQVKPADLLLRYLGPQEAAHVMMKTQLERCSGSFTVMSTDSCAAYRQECPGVVHLCCQQEGKTCSEPKADQLSLGDSCHAAYEGQECVSEHKDLTLDNAIDWWPKTALQQRDQVLVGNWIKTWSTKQMTPEPLFMVLCFSGFVKLEDALAECERTKGSMAQGPLWLSVGGGNCNAAAGGSVAWSEEVLQDFLAKIKTVDLSSYKGIMFDLEANSGGCKAAIAAGTPGVCAATSGTDYGTTPSAELFQQAYDAVKAKGLEVGVSWSYQMPYCMDNAAEIVKTALQSDAVAIVSPQMYGGGTFNPNPYAPQVWNGNSEVSYSDYVNLKGAIYPSYTLANGKYDMATNLATMEQMQQDMKNWATAKKYQAFIDSPGCLAYQNS